MDYVAHLKKDKKLATAIGTAVHELQVKKNLPLRLMASIMSQQLNTKVAAVIYRRFLELYSGNEPIPQQVLDTPFEQLRAIGLSNNKVSYIQNVARFCIDNNIADNTLIAMPNDEIITLLTQIKGVGKWTVEMLLMFSLGREDVFAIDDLVIQQMVIKLYKLDTTNKKILRENLLKISAKWQPYRTYACLYLWRYKDAIPDL